MPAIGTKRKREGDRDSGIPGDLREWILSLVETVLYPLIV